MSKTDVLTIFFQRFNGANATIYHCYYKEDGPNKVLEG